MLFLLYIGTIKNNFLEVVKMKIYKEVSGNDFEFWSGAVATAEALTYEEIETVFSILEELYPEGASETEINDFFWFEDDTIAEWLGYKNFEEVMNRWKI